MLLPTETLAWALLSRGQPCCCPCHDPPTPCAPSALQAGQFIQAKTSEDGKPGFFAIASAPGADKENGTVELLIKSQPGATAEQLCAAESGEAAGRQGWLGDTRAGRWTVWCCKIMQVQVLKELCCRMAAQSGPDGHEPKLQLHPTRRQPACGMHMPPHVHAPCLHATRPTPAPQARSCW